MKITCAHGTVQQFEDAIKNRIGELGGDADTITSATDDTDSERYIHNLIGQVDNELGDLFDSVTFDTNDDSVIVTTINGESVHEYNIPKSDLNMKFDDIDSDCSYICDHIKNDIDACSNITSAEDDFDADIFDYHTLIPAIKEKLESVGVDVESPEADDYIDEQAFMIAESDEKDVDYWWEETQSDPMFMDVVDELPHIDTIDSNCEICGRPLNEMGTCPVCDDGEEDY